MTILKYDVTLRVSGKRLPEILQQIGADVALVTVKPVQEGTGPVEPQRTFKYVGGTRLKGISGADLLMEILGSEKRAFTMTEIANGFEKRGFSPNSASPQLHFAKKKGKVRDLGRGMWCLPGTTIKLGDLQKG